MARRNSQILNRTHLIALGVAVCYLVCRILFFRPSFSRASLLTYALLSGPGLAIETFFELNSRPSRGSQDLEAKGITESMWDVLYWTWACTILAAVVGDRAWWLYVRHHTGFERSSTS